MKPAELFGVAVRTVGLLVLLGAAWATFIGLLGIIGGGPTGGMLFFAIPALAVGFFLLRGGANVVVGFAYPNKES